VEVLGSKDSGVQKRGYKILTRLVDSEKVRIDAEAVLRQLNELADCLAAAAKKVRGPSLPTQATFVLMSVCPGPL
jgi:ribosomal RNA-processing protein 12